MRSWINGILLFSDDCIHAEVHFIKDDTFLDTSCIYKSLLILDLSIIHLQADKHSIVASLVKSNHVDDDCVGFMGLTWG